MLLYLSGDCGDDSIIITFLIVVLITWVPDSIDSVIIVGSLFEVEFIKSTESREILKSI
jgi:hypothetical protein